MKTRISIWFFGLDSFFWTVVCAMVHQVILISCEEEQAQNFSKSKHEGLDIWEATPLHGIGFATARLPWHFFQDSKESAANGNGNGKLGMVKSKGFLVVPKVRLHNPLTRPAIYWGWEWRWGGVKMSGKVFYKTWRLLESSPFCW